jgi:predicted Ser/Thr protein kinase
MADPLTKAGRYDVVRELGRGSMGIVYQGYDPVIGRTVAIKTMLTEGLSPQEFEEFKARFQREAQAAGVLSHPNIVNIFDYGEDNGILYLIMEYLEGKSLEKLVEGQNILPIETIIPMYDQVCGALDHAHQHGIVHRDIKPANIMILDNGLVKVTDFGIAKMVSMGMTQAGQVLGTPNYMSPEQVKGRQVDGRSDIFSLGVILYDLLTGEMPFSGQNVTTVIYKIINENPIPPRELDATIHPGLSYVVCKALAKSPDERYQTCRALADDLRNFKCLGTAPSATIKVNIPTLQITEAERAAALPVESLAPPVAPPEAAVIAPASAYQKLLASPMGWALIAMLGVVILGVLGGARYLYLHKRKLQVVPLPVGQLLVESNIAGAQISIDGQSGPNWVTPYTIPALSPGSHQVVVSKEGYNDYQQTVTVEGGKTNSLNASLTEQAPGAPVQGATEQARAGKGKRSAKENEVPGAVAGSLRSGVATKMGQLLVTANVEAAKISVDGHSEPDWVTPHSSTIALSAGTHYVVVSKDGYDDYERSLTIEGGKTATLNAHLSVGIGEVIIVTTPPGLDVFIDGKLIGRSPTHQSLNAGDHKYVIQGPGVEPSENSFNLPSGAIKRITLRLGGEVAATGIVTVKTIPPGASIMADDRPIEGQTPTSFSLPVGKHTLYITLLGFRPVRQPIEVKASGTVPVNVTMPR